LSFHHVISFDGSFYSGLRHRPTDVQGKVTLDQQRCQSSTSRQAIL
ncbi:hypothetical protein CEXT_282281, partial [Caerostris extrusa]